MAEVEEMPNPYRTMEYTIDEGDTIARLCKRFDMTPEELVRYTAPSNPALTF